jgi:hypothetical protein
MRAHVAPRDLPTARTPVTGRFPRGRHSCPRPPPRRRGRGERLGDRRSRSGLRRAVRPVRGCREAPRRRRERAGARRGRVERAQELPAGVRSQSGPTPLCRSRPGTPERAARSSGDHPVALGRAEHRRSKFTKMRGASCRRRETCSAERVLQPARAEEVPRRTRVRSPPRRDERQRCATSSRCAVRDGSLDSPRAKWRTYATCRQAEDAVERQMLFGVRPSEPCSCSSAFPSEPAPRSISQTVAHASTCRFGAASTAVSASSRRCEVDEPSDGDAPALMLVDM